LTDHHGIEGLSRAEYAVLTGGFVAGLLLIVGVLRRDSLLVEAVAMGVSVAVFLYWFDFAGKQ
jgi:hypothetical protein